eukprot:TRINITY_DN63067_c0_g1_i1.p1 TRINITY_DN63067_c0_g1~~TRINITY_DN63067_c0_g1_i1.p1  ORF type:complete len:507 (+),score=73.24 TRINITY_DN63067_c0_g1_i1:88-1608(+)
MVMAATLPYATPVARPDVVRSDTSWSSTTASCCSQPRAYGWLGRDRLPSSWPSMLAAAGAAAGLYGGIQAGASQHCGGSGPSSFSACRGRFRRRARRRGLFGSIPATVVREHRSSFQDAAASDIATGINDQLLSLRTSQLKRELRVRGLDTSASFDRSSLLELGVSAGLLPAAAAPHVVQAGDVRKKRSKRRRTEDPADADVVVALRRVMGDASLLPLGTCTDGERLALPLWRETEGSKAEPMWFLLDTLQRRTFLAYSAAERLAVKQSPTERGKLELSGLRFGDAEVPSLRDVGVLPDGAPIFGDQVSGILGLDFLHSWDIDLDVARLRCYAWKAGDTLARGFGAYRDGVQVELRGTQGLLEVEARLRGTVCSNSDASGGGPPIRAVVDLGQTYSSCNWAAARQVDISGPHDPCVREAGTWLGLNGREVEVYEADMGVALAGRVAGVLPGERIMDNRHFWIAESLPLLERLGFNPAEPCAILGLDTVGRSRLSFSARQRKLAIPS